ncbi:MAG: zf-HC2 domain-containing protein, partial [Acidimicrobiia bacterium]
MPTVTHAEAGELLAAYALDAVTDDERREIDAHVATCATCADELARHREAAGLIAQTELPTPSGQWERIEAAIGERPQVVSRARRRRTLVAAAVVATVAAAAAAALTFVLVDDADKE